MRRFGTGRTLLQPTNRVGVVAVFLTHIEDASDQTTYSGGVWNGINFGTFTPDRKIVVALGTRNSGGTQAYSSGAIGDDASPTSQNAQGDTGSRALFLVGSPTGTSGNISITFNGANSRLGAGVWAIYGASSATPSNSGFALNQLTNYTASFTIPSLGVGLGYIFQLGSTSTFTESASMIERFDTAVETTITHGGADCTDAGTATRGFTASSTGNGIAIYSAWGP